MKYRALRGVCIGVGRVLTPADDPVDLDPATGQYLVSLKAVEVVEDPPPPPAEEPPAPIQKSAPAKSGKEK